MNRLHVCIAVLFAALQSGCVTEHSNARPVEPEKAAELYAQLGFRYLQKQRPDLAEQKFQKALELGSNRVDATYGLGLVRFTQGQTIDGRKLIDEAAERISSDEKLRPVIAQWYCDAHFLEKTERLLKPLLKASNPNAILQWSDCLNDNGESERSEQVVLSALRQNPTAGQYLLFMTVRSVEQEDWLRADMFLQRYDAAAPATSKSLLMGVRVAAALKDESLRTLRLQQLERLNPSLARRINPLTGEFLREQ